MNKKIYEVADKLIEKGELQKRVGSFVYRVQDRDIEAGEGRGELRSCRRRCDDQLDDEEDERSDNVVQNIDPAGALCVTV